MSWRWAIVVLGVLALLADAAWIRARPPRGAAVPLRIEPESNAWFAPGSHPIALPEASGGGAVLIDGWNIHAPDYGRRVAGETAYPVPIAFSGRYDCWVRVRWSGPCSNSITLAIVRGSGTARGELPQEYPRHLVGNDVVFDRWHWVRGPALDLEAGDCRVFMGTREAHVAVDCILFTLDHDYDPAAQETAATASDNGGEGMSEPLSENFTGGPDRWLLDGSEWRLLRRSGLSAIGPCRATTSLAQARMPVLSAGRLECALRITAVSSAGFFFGKSGDDYFVARLCGSRTIPATAGRLQICRVRGDSLRVLAEGPPVRLREPEWELLTLWFAGSRCGAVLSGQPVLGARLPRDVSGSVGLYVDGGNGGLRPLEYPEEFRWRGRRQIRLADYPLPESLATAEWPGLVVPLAGGDMLVLRWTNPAPVGDYVMRAELARIRPDGSSRVVAQRWGVFQSDSKYSLGLDWTQGKIVATVAGSIMGEVVGRPADDQGALLKVGEPRVLFADFTAEPLSFARSRYRLGGAGDRGAVSEPSGEGLGFPPFHMGVLSAALPARAIPYAWIFDFDENGTADTLGVRRNAKDKLVLDWTANGKSRTVALPGLRDSASTIVLQACFDFGEFLAIVDGRLCFQSGRPIQAMVHGVQSTGEAGSPPALFSSLPRPTPYFTMAHGWSAASLSRRELHGDAALSVPGSDLSPGLGRLKVRLHSGAAGQEGSGYELDIRRGRVATWEMRRNGRPVSGGWLTWNLESGLTLYQCGSVVWFDVGTHPVFGFCDPHPLRSGHVGLEGIAVTDATAEAGSTLCQSWDALCVFYQDINALASMALWSTCSGAWSLEEAPDQLEGYLVGRQENGTPAVLEYERSLDATVAVLELSFLRSRLRPGQRLSVLLGDDAARPREGISFDWPGGDQIVCDLRRSGTDTRTVCEMEPGSSAPTLTIVRTPDKTILELDHRPIAECRSRLRGPIGRLWLEVEGPTETGPAIASFCIQQNPYDAPRLPENVTRLLTLLGDAARDVSTSGR